MIILYLISLILDFCDFGFLIIIRKTYNFKLQIGMSEVTESILFRQKLY